MGISITTAIAMGVAVAIEMVLERAVVLAKLLAIAGRQPQQAMGIVLANAQRINSRLSSIGGPSGSQHRTVALADAAISSVACSADQLPATRG